MWNDLFNQKTVTKFQLAEEVCKEDKNHFLLDYFPRVGKSISAIELVKKWDSKKVLILSDALLTNKQWRENIKKYNPHLLNRIHIQCYQSLHKIDKDAYDTILLDEFDLATTQKRLAFIEEFKVEHWIAMSGTLTPNDIHEFRLLTKGKYFHAKVEFKQAVKWGILPQPKVFKVRLDLDKTNPYLLYHYSNDKKKKNEIVSFYDRWESVKNKKVNTIVKCTEHQYFDILESEISKWTGYEKEFNLPPEERSSTVLFLQKIGITRIICKNKVKKLGNQRKKFFADIKNKYMRRLLNELPQDSRKLIFCNDTAQADMLNEKFAVHSKRPESVELVEDFNNKKINTLFACKMVDRGIDFIDVDYLIIIQSSGAQGGQVQRFGRALLSKNPKVVLFYVNNTKDEQNVNYFLNIFELEWIIQKHFDVQTSLPIQ